MIGFCKENLGEIRDLIGALSEEQYQYKSCFLSDSTIGQHVRHILEFYVCLMNGVPVGTVNYDKRNRDLNIETNGVFAQQTIANICREMKSLPTDVMLILEGEFAISHPEKNRIKTSIKRELAYCFEHSIHHQALIKIALKEQEIDHLITSSFGVAPATIRFQEKGLLAQ